MIKPEDVGKQIRELRQQRGMSLRTLAQKAGVSVSFVSKIDAGRGSPTLATLLKLVEALDLSMPEFLAVSDAQADRVLVQRQNEMQVLSDEDKLWRYLFPCQRAVKAIMTYEEYRPQTRQAVMEEHLADVCGLVLEGELTLTVKGKAPVSVQTGDSFYIIAGTPHIAANQGRTVLRMVVTELPHTRVLSVARGRHSRTRRPA
jgi:transcriptional regulator with XRE-family HTH domain